MEQPLNKNILLNIIKSTSTAIFPLLVYPYILRVLGANGIGKVNFSLSVINYFSAFASLGMSSYAIRECSRLINDNNDLEKTASVLFSINIVATIVAYICLFFLLFFKTFRNYRSLLILQSLSIICTTFGADWLNVAMSDFKYLTLRTLCIQCLSLILIYSFVKTPDDYIKYAFILVFSNSGSSVLNYFYRKKFCNIYLIFNSQFKTHLKKIIPFFLLLITQTIYTNGCITLLGIFKGDYEVGIFSLSNKIYLLVNTLVASVSLVIIPTVSNSYAKNDVRKMQYTLNFALKFILMMGVPAIVGLNIACKEIVLLFAGEQFLGSIIPLHILTVAMFFSFISGFMSSICLIPTGDEHICLYASITSTIVSVLSGLFFIPKWGECGAAISVMLSELVGCLVLIKKVVNRLNYEHDKNFAVSLFLGNFFIIIVGFLSQLFGEISTIQMLVFKITFSVLGYIIIMIFFRNSIFFSLLNKKKIEN